MSFPDYKTKKGTELPLMNLKGKPYMQVAHRLVWFTEDVASYTISTSFPVLTADETVAHVIVSVYDKDGKTLKSVTATKREDKKSFADHTEKAETGAIGRALALLGFGTQFAIADLEEGDRLADSPVALPAKTKFVAGPTTTTEKAVETGTKKVSFSKKAATTTTIATSSGDDI